jgi:ectoine hydroxylase-related dioxygenase (phytanoyl-CoA dioxygenase family)
MMITAIFRDPGLQARFERDGYVVFDFVSAEQAAVIAEKYYQLQKEIPGGFSSTASNPDSAFKKAISDHAGQVISASMDEVFQNYKKLGITFLCKAPGKDGKVPVHRDWMVVDESKYFSGTIWVPMVDVNDANGALRVWPGSHKFFNHIRSSSIPVAYQPYEDEIWDQMTVVPMKAGQAFLLNHALIHASSPNLTDKERLILVCGIVPAEARLSYYHGTGKGTVEKFDMPDDMFMKHSEIGGRPAVGVIVEEFEYSVEPENRLRVQQLLTSSRLERTAKPLFAEENLQRSFATTGYMKVPLLTTSEVNDFKVKLKDQPAGSLPSGVRQKIDEILSSKIPFNDGRLKVIDARLDIKRKNENTPEPIHQQLSCVEDEDEYCSVTCLIALDDVKIESGAEGYIEGSHLFLGNKRPSPQPVASYTFKGNELDVLPYLQTGEMKAGEAIIMDDRLFRCSLPNSGPNNIMTVTIRLVHSKSQLCHYYLNPDGQTNSMLKYLVDDAFFKKYDNKALTALYEKGSKIPDYNIADTIIYKYPGFTTDELLELIKASGGKINKPLAGALMKNELYLNYILEKEGKSIPVSAGETVADKNFWSTYSPLNIVREIKRRVLG